MTKDDLVIRIGGESGEGIVTTGEVFARIAAFTGLDIYTVRTIPAEIKGGHVMFQLRTAPHRIYSQGDELNMLLAFNQEGYDKHHALLRPDGLLVYNSNELTPPDDGRMHFGLPLNELARQIDFMRGKNIIAIGALVKFFDLPYEKARQVVETHLGRKGGELLRQNLVALETGYKYVAEHGYEEPPFHLEGPARERDNRLVISGNQALSLGALAAGCTFYAGYPITPASDIMEFLAAQLPKVGGTMIQAEDEIAALAMAIGASFTGARAMTATSGPGLALMIELLGHATATETPVVVVDVQRAGPSTGMPTKVSQGDLRLAMYAANDDAARFCVAPVSVEDCFYQTINAFNLAEKYQLPVVLLSDQDMSVRMETIPPFDMSRALIEPRLLANLDGNGRGKYERYALTESGISPMSLPGMRGGQYTAEGLTHVPSGAPDYTPEWHRAMMEKRFQKLRSARPDIQRWRMLEEWGDEDAELGIIGWGSTIGPVREAMEMARAHGIKSAAIYPKCITPLPDEELRLFIAKHPTVLVPELNYTGQFAHVLRARYKQDFIRLNKYEGVPFLASEVFEKIKEIHMTMERSLFMSIPIKEMV